MPVVLPSQPAVPVDSSAPAVSALIAHTLWPRQAPSQAGSVASCGTFDDPTDARRIASSTTRCTPAADDAQSSSGDPPPDVEQGLDREDFECTAEQGAGDGATCSQDSEIAIPAIPRAASEWRMAELLADLHQPSGVRQPFWRDSRQLSLIAEINQLRGLPGPRAAAMDVRQRNIEMLSLHPQWKAVLPWPLATLCRAITDGQHDLTFPLTINGQREQVPLSTLCCLEPDQTFHALVSEIPAAVRASRRGRNRLAVRMVEHCLPDVSLVGIIHYNAYTQRALHRVAEQSHQLPAPVPSDIWNVVKDCTPVSQLQLQQIRMLLDTRQRNIDDVAANERSIVAALEASACSWGTLSSAELFDMTEDLLAAAALRLEIDLGLIMGFAHSVLTPFQCACFVGAAYPLRCDWLALANRLAGQALPPDS
ncbi:hypothetical protein WJX74_002966 [Apatococcus lobatus]|uniref:Uncharacterized protein n=1 Tax=Apatococcus lobatus TaxID=904363 RepID=A0AAW1SFP5_9CHLO